MKHVWRRKPAFWEDKRHRYCSVIFSWQLYELLEKYKNNGPKTNKKMVIGGPATQTLKEIIPKEIEVRNNIPSLYRHNPLATKTSTGCIRKCKFCIVPTNEGPLKELKKWEVKPIVIDNNLLACSVKHFDSVIDKLKKLPWCDFNQGLDMQLLTKHHVERFCELQEPVIRISLDHISLEKIYLNKITLLKTSGIPVNSMRVYVLFGFKDTPEDALVRLRIVQKSGALPVPMRYQPVDTPKRNSFVDKNWTDENLKRFVQYWGTLRVYACVPFEEFVYMYSQKEQREAAERAK